MSNPLDGNWAGVQPATAGSATSWGDNFSALFAASSKVDSLLGIDSEVQSRWENTVRLYNQRTGVDSRTPVDMRTLGEFTRPIIDPENQRSWANTFLGVGGGSEFPERAAAAAEQLRATNERLKALNDPALPSLEKIIQDSIAARGEIQQRAAQAEETGGALGWIPRLAGGMAGSLTSNDPENIASMFLPGGWGKNLAMKLGTEVAINAGVGAATQEYAINPTRAALGEEEGSVAEAALFGGLGALVLRGGAEGLGALARKGVGVRGEMDLGSFNFEDPQLRSMFERNAADPSARAGTSLLDLHESFQSANPYAATEAGMKRFTGEIDDVLAALNGKTDTAGITIARATADTADFSLENLDYHTQVVKEQTPWIYNRVEEASGAIQRIDQDIANATQAFDNPSVAEAVGRIDEVSGGLVAEAEAIARDMQQPQAVREAAALKVEQIASSLGTDVERLRADATIAPKKELQALRQSRKVAVKEFKAARQSLDQRIEQVKAAELVKQITEPNPTVMGKGEDKAPGQRYDVVEATNKAVDEAGEANVAAMNKMDEAFTEPTKDGSPEPDPGTVRETADGYDLGDGVSIPKNFEFLIDGKKVKASELWADLKGDAELVQAMKVCAI